MIPYICKITVIDLERLKAAGMITLQSSTVIEEHKKSSYSWYGRSYYTVDVDHIFVEVALTEEGKKLVVETPAKKSDEISKLLAANDGFKEVMPDYINADYDGGQSQQTVKEESIVEEVEEETVAADTVVAESGSAEAIEETPAQKQSSTDSNAAYNAAVARVDITKVEVLLGKYKFEKAYNVLCSHEMMEKGVATCKFLYTFEDKTPFGYVLGAPKQGYMYVGIATFVHYSDRGWIIEEFEKNVD